MIFDFHQSPTDDQIQLSNLKIRLQKIASNSVLDSTSERDQLENETIAFIRENIFDAIEGGFYQKKEQGFRFDCEHNAIIAEFLLLADRVFYHGEFSHIALRMLDFLVSHCCDESRECFTSQLDFHETDLPFVCQGERLIEWTTGDELKLLTNLLPIQQIEETKNYCLNYVCSLKEASASSLIDYKQSQILQASIERKLRARISERYEVFHLSLNERLETHSCIIKALIQAIVWYQAEKYRHRASKIIQTFFDELSTLRNRKDYSSELIIDLCYTLVEYLQVEFNADILPFVAERLNTLLESNTEQLNELASSRLAFLEYILNYFHQTSDSSSYGNCAFRLNFKLPSVTLRIYRIKPDAEGHRQRQQLLNRYDANLRIYSY